MFNVEVFPVSNFIYEKNQFIEDVRYLRDRLTNRISDDYYFKNDNLSNIPFDGLYMYFKDIW